MFESKFIKGSEDECWEWIACKDKDGYGRIKFNGKSEHAHRVAWKLYNGPIPKGQHVLHKCDNRKCVNYVKHLFLGTNLDNVRDRVNKGRNGNIKGEKHGRAKLIKEQIIEIRNSNENGVYLSKKFNISESQISRIRKKELWKHIF